MQMLQHTGARVVPGLGVLLLAGCFVGSAADGLPCRTDADCGIGVACMEDPSASALCCGGTCSTSAGTRGSSGTTTTETDPSSSSGTVGMESSSGGSGNSTTGPMCGNGVVDEGEECDPGAKRPCSDDCLLCGNGVVEDDELCDPGQVAQGVTCEDACHRLVLLSWDMDSPAMQVEVDFERPAFETRADGTLRWRRSADVSAPLTSGPYFMPDGGPPLDPSMGWPQALLLTRPLEFPALTEADEVVVSIDHAYMLNSDDAPRFFDHGRVDLVPAGAASTRAWTRLLPEEGEGGEPNCEGAVPPPVVDCYPPRSTPSEPFCDPGFDRWLVGEGMDNVKLPIDGGLVSGQTLQVSFRLRYDCGTLTSGTDAVDDAWALNALSVVVTRSH